MRAKERKKVDRSKEARSFRNGNLLLPIWSRVTEERSRCPLALGALNTLLAAEAVHFHCFSQTVKTVLTQVDANTANK